MVYVNMATKLPKLNDQKLAEFVGCMIGDGHIGTRNNEISITGNKILDLGHFFYICKLCETLFGITPKVYVHKKTNVSKIKFYSKEVRCFLNKLGLSRGKKVKSNLKIPKIYFLDKELLKPCIRGIFDTDGCICRHRKNDPMIEIDSYNKKLRESILKGLKSLNFKVSVSGRKIYIYSKRDIIKFFDEIGSKNTRHTIKYMFWVKTNIMIRTRDIKSSNLKTFKKISNLSNNENWVGFRSPELFKIVDYKKDLNASVV